MLIRSIRKRLSILKEYLITKSIILKHRNRDISVGRSVYIASGAVLSSRAIEIGDYTRINGKITIKGTGKVSIGKYCAIGSDVKIISDMHITSRASLQEVFYRRNFGESILIPKGNVSIGNDVWIGDSTIILSGVMIGDGAVIGAGAVVTRDVLPYTVVGGIPAKKIKDRFSEGVKEQLLRLRWWDWPQEKIKANKEFFMSNIEESFETDLDKFIK